MAFHLKNSTIHSLKHLFSEEKVLKDYVRASTSDQDIPAIVIRKLAQFKLLKGIPFHYLVPHPELLPEESIKFFYLDPNWINALVDGAFNIGRYATKGKEISTHDRAAHISEVHDEIHSDVLHQQCLASALNHRSYMLKETENFVDNKKALFTSQGGINAQVSGFILRSKVVSQWQNLKVMGHKEKVGDVPNEPMKIYRLDHLSEEILFCLFEGDFKQLDIHQPSQGIHFGLDKKNKSNDGGFTFEKKLRSDDSKSTIGAVTVPLRDEDTQVVNLAELSRRMAAKIKPDYFDSEKQAHLLSSDFALQMVKGVGIVRYLRD